MANTNFAPTPNLSIQETDRGTWDLTWCKSVEKDLPIDCTIRVGVIFERKEDFAFLFEKTNKFTELVELTPPEFAAGRWVQHLDWTIYDIESVAIIFNTGK
jgi:hypothetical protein